MKIYSVNDYNWIQINKNKIVDLAVGNHYAGCRCSIKGEVGECKDFEDCLDLLLSLLNKI